MKAQRIAVGLAGILLAGLVGCSKDVELEFHNATAQTLDVAVTAPGTGYEPVGIVAPYQQLRYELELSREVLPAPVLWSAGTLGGQVMVTEDTESPVRIVIGTPAEVDAAAGEPESPPAQ